jgi:hypothetical protein
VFLGRLAGIEKVGGYGVAHEMHMVVGRAVGESGVAPKEGLDLALPESAALPAEEEGGVLIGAGAEIVPK